MTDQITPDDPIGLTPYGIAMEALERILDAIDDTMHRTYEDVRKIASDGHSGAVLRWQGRRGAGEAPVLPVDPARYALVELMGHRSMVGEIREVTFLGEPRLEIHRIDTVPAVTVTVGPESIYALTSLTRDQAEGMSLTYGRSDGGLSAAGVVTRYIDEHRRAIEARPDDADGAVDAELADDQDDDGRSDYEREQAEEGNRVGHAHDDPDDDRDHHGDEGGEDTE